MVLVCLLLGASALIIGLAVYVSTMTRQYVRHAYEIASHAQMSAKHGTDSMAPADEVMTIYRSLTPEQRQKIETDPDEYRSYFSSIDTEEGGGDFFDFFMTDSDHLCLVMADVSGKGGLARRCSSPPLFCLPFPRFCDII